MKDLTWIKTGTFAHRGLHDKVIPENSLKAFHEAVKHGYDIEMDIRLTKDNKLVVFHDENLQRMCDVNVTISSLNYDELAPYYLKHTDQKIMLLSDILKEIPLETTLLIELKKSKDNKRMVQEFLTTVGNDQHTFAIHSFEPSILRHFKKMAPEIIRGLIAKSNPTRYKLVNKVIPFLPIIPLIKPDFINYKFEDLPNQKMDKLKKKGMVIISYTVRSKKGLDFIKTRYDNAVFEGFRPVIK